MKCSPSNLSEVIDSCFELIQIQMNEKRQQQILDIGSPIYEELYLIDAQRIS